MGKNGKCGFNAGVAKRMYAMKRPKVALARVNYSQLYGVYDGGKTTKQRDILPPYQLLTLAGYVRDKGAEVKIFDGEVELQSQEELARDILDWKPDLAGLTSTTPDIDLTVEVCDVIKEVNPCIVTLVGGPHASAQPQNTIEYPSVDYVAVGDGESAIVDIMNANSLHILGDNIKQGGTIDIGNNPMPAHDLIDYSKYTFSDPNRGLKNAASIMTTRGCPYACTFCFHNRKLRFKNIETVMAEIKYLYEHGVRYFYVYDDTFFVKKTWVYQIIDKIRELKITDACFQCLTRGNLVDPKLLEALREVGFVRISMGVESGSDAILKRVQKGVKKADYKKACKLIREYDIETRGSFILGHPHETPEDIQATIDFSKELELYHANFNVMTPYPGTQVYELAKKGDGIRFTKPEYETNWAKYRRWGNSIIETDALKADDLVEAQIECQREFYSQQKVYDYYHNLFLGGNKNLYFYRPLNFGWKEKYGKDVPFWKDLDQSTLLDPKKQESFI